jgi:hypothetical protein
VLDSEIPLGKLLGPDPLVAVTDDRPYNEYFLLRRWALAAQGYWNSLAASQRR